MTDCLPKSPVIRDQTYPWSGRLACTFANVEQGFGKVQDPHMHRDKQ